MFQVDGIKFPSPGPISALNLTWWYGMSADLTYDSLYMFGITFSAYNWVSHEIGCVTVCVTWEASGRESATTIIIFLLPSMQYSDSQAIPSSQLAICFYTYPLVELVGFLPCLCVLVHIVYLLHINKKKKKRPLPKSHYHIWNPPSGKTSPNNYQSRWVWF